jgi:hypothetical protein
LRTRRYAAAIKGVVGKRLVGLLAATGAAFAWSAAPAPAPVPPKNCGFMTVKGKRYNVKSDQMRCRKARRKTRSYLKGGGEPRGFDCTRYGRETNIAFRCQKGQAVFFAIRR